ncbi:hypothetical protein CLTEP_09890 [Clostridium tepidiprofundi DSM 19306]|uniref:YhaN AAA domain-containing protein n=1 Tax=Clostridium tepidiprofundi DSM 19306 TaxID=1121338 RepID=A0A151B530_9CLOT|nr:AAA family ATPase [Clostridium tepidiprofundi]KYH34996.1 hypothetical protein CLTEP_09890 [Clostridium tepidiprofundi DSM 19306]
MKIHSLDIRDMGIFQGEKLEGLSNRIIVIGGLNRAGKTTFMQILRHLGYGFNSKDILPPPRFEYDVRSTVVLEDGKKYNMLLKKNNSPVISSENGYGDITCNEIYGNIDSYTYKELFTISLDEISRIDDKNNSKLNTVLLGAGLKDIVKVPGLIKNFNKEAEKIGGKRGNPSTKQFKPYYEVIKKGSETYSKAKLELYEYKNKCEQICEVEKLLYEKQLDIIKIENEIIVLDVLKNNYEVYNKWKNIKVECEKYKTTNCIEESDLVRGKELYKQYKEINEEYEEVKYEYVKEVSSDLNSKDLYIKHKQDILMYSSELSGTKEKLKNLFDSKKKINNKVSSVMYRMKTINNNWDSFDVIQNINCDKIKLNMINDNIQKYDAFVNQSNSLNNEIETLKVSKNTIEKQIKDLNIKKNSFYLKWYFIINLITVIIGGALLNYDKSLATAVIIIGAIGAGLCMFIVFNSSKENKKIYNTLIRNIEEIGVQLDIKEKRYCEICNEVKKLESIFNKYRNEIHINKDCSVFDMREYYKSALDLSREINEIINEKRKLSGLENKLNFEINDYKQLVKKFIDNIDGQELFIYMEKLYKNLAIAEKFNDINHKKTEVDNKIRELLNKYENVIEVKNTNDCFNVLNEFIIKGEKYKKFVEIKVQCNLLEERLNQALKTDRISNAFSEMLSLVFSEREYLVILEKGYEKYTSLAGIEEEYIKLKENRKILLDEKEQLRNQLQRLKFEKEKLLSDETIERARELINEGRGGLYTLAEKYAVYKTASLILSKVQKRFLDETKNTLLKYSGDMMKLITSGEIEHIQPVDDLNVCDFKTIHKDGHVYDSSDMLSRGTCEQLFLSVRLSRIKEITPPLPVIFDDSFVNFDEIHMKNVLILLAELSKTHQIFVLTCHSKLIELISNISNDIQYWKLEKGRFSLSSSKKLIEYLSTPGV